MLRQALLRSGDRVLCTVCGGTYAKEQLVHDSASNDSLRWVWKHVSNIKKRVWLQSLAVWSSRSHLFDRLDVRFTVPATHPSPLRSLVVSRLQWCITIVGGAVAGFSAGLSNWWQVLGFGPYHFGGFHISVSLVLSSVVKEGAVMRCSSVQSRRINNIYCLL